MLEVAKIKVSNNLQGVFNLTLEGEYASYFEVQGTTLFMIKPIEDIGTYAITVVVEDPMGRFETLRTDYVFNIGCCPISTRPTTTTPAPVSAPTAPAPLPTEDGPEDLSTARILGIMEGLPDVQRYAMRTDTSRSSEYYDSSNYKLYTNSVFTGVKNYDSIFTYPDGTTFIREGRTSGTNSFVSPDGIMHQINSSLFSLDIARITNRDFDPNIKFDYPGLFDGMRFNISDREFLYVIDKDGFSGPEDLTSLQTYRFEISNFVKTILSPSYTGPFDVNTTGRSRPELFQRMFNENSSTNIARLRSFYNLVYSQYRNTSSSRALDGLLSRVFYHPDDREEERWGRWMFNNNYPSQRNWYNRTSDMNRIIEYYGNIFGLENLYLDSKYRDAYLNADETRYEIQNHNTGFSINYYREKFHIVAVLFEIPKALYDRERRSQRYSIFPQLIVHKQQYNPTTGTTKTVNPNGNFSGRGVSAQVIRPSVNDLRFRALGSPFNELVSPGNIALIGYFRIDDELVKYGKNVNFFPNTVGPVRDRPQEEQNLVLEARLFNGGFNDAIRFLDGGVLDRRFAESFVYSELCGATGYNSVDSVTAPTPTTTTTTEPPVAEDPEDPEEEIEVFKMGNLNIEN